VSCEKCWADSGGDADRYRQLLVSHISGQECSPEEQAGPGATLCDGCGRRAVHQHAGMCMACGWEADEYSKLEDCR
jgi:hypothetical protein